jgi:hypothetical protein
MRRNEMTDAEVLFTQVWREVLEVDQIGLDDDFFSLGGDSLLAIQVVGAAAELGLPVTLLHLFKNPTVRGACVALSGADALEAAADLPSALDQAELPDGVSEAWPAARLQLGLIYEALLSAGSAYTYVISRIVNQPLDVSVLREALNLLARRHPALRSRFDLASFSEPMQLVESDAQIPLVIADYRGLTEAETGIRYEETMRDLAEPFDPERAPLLRAHVAAAGANIFRFSYAFHHAMMDGWSEAVFFNELLRTYAGLLDGSPPKLTEPVPYREFVRLERLASADPEAIRAFRELLPPRPKPAAPPEPAPLVQSSASAVLPDPDTRQLVAYTVEWGLPIKSLLLAVCCSATGAVEDTTAPVVGLIMNGRPELLGADVTLGLFVNQLPLRLDLREANWHDAARQALAAENSLLPYRRFPHSEVRRLLGSDPFTVTFNYMHYRPRDELITSGLVGAAEDVRGAGSLPVAVDAFYDPQAEGLSLQVVADATQFGEQFAERFVSRMLHAVSRLISDPNAQILQDGG